MVLSRQETYFMLARSASILREEAINSCILFDPIFLLDCLPVANIVCMYDYYSYVGCIILQTVHYISISFRYLVNVMVLKYLQHEYRNNNLFADEVLQSDERKRNAQTH